jgi:hypothetical protein
MSGMTPAFGMDDRVHLYNLMPEVYDHFTGQERQRSEDRWMSRQLAKNQKFVREMALVGRAIGDLTKLYWGGSALIGTGAAFPAVGKGLAILGMATARDEGEAGCAAAGYGLAAAAGAASAGLPC